MDQETQGRESGDSPERSGAVDYGIPEDTPGSQAVPGRLSPERDAKIKEITRQSTNLVVNSFCEAWLVQMGENLRRGGTTRKSVADFRIPPERDKDTIIICGPGASVKSYTDIFPELHKYATIIGVPTALYWMKKNGLYPDFVVSADSNESQPILLEAAENDVPVLAPVTAHPDLGDQEDVYWYGVLMGDGKPNPEENRFAWWDVPTMYMNKDVDWNYPSVGCVINMAVQLAMDFRARGVSSARRIVLLGVDFGPWDGLRRAPANKTMDDYPSIPEDEAGWVPWGNHVTDPVSLTYKRVLLEMWQQKNPPLYSMSHGLMAEFPQVDFDNFRLDRWPEPTAKKTIDRLTLNYLELFADNFPTITQEHYKEATEAIMNKQPSRYGGTFNVMDGVRKT